MSKKNNPAENMVQSGYAALAKNKLMDDLAEDLTGLSLKYDRVKIPSALSPMFEVPGEDGEVRRVLAMVSLQRQNHRVERLLRLRMVVAMDADAVRILVQRPAVVKKLVAKAAK